MQKTFNSHCIFAAMIERYLKKRRFLERQIDAEPDANLELIIVIPAYYEDEIEESLLSINECEQEDVPFEVIVVINHAENADSNIKRIHHKQSIQLTDFARDLTYPLHIIRAFDLPSKKAGVGLARKIGMDEAAERLSQTANQNGIICCLDADSYVSKNYVQTIFKHFQENPKSEASHCNFEHRLFSEGNPLNEAIINYELHLRYYKHAKAYTGHPHIMYTIGSCISVRAEAYAAEGGMPIRKAGEDFYFLNKFLSKGKVDFLPDVFVYPSSRVSERVPFGTGRAMFRAISGEDLDSTYDFRSFIALKQLFDDLEEGDEDLLESNSVDSEKDLNDQFREDTNFTSIIDNARQHSASKQGFYKRFFQLFDHFQVMKYIHYSRDKYYPNIALNEACQKWFDETGKEKPVPANNLDWLLYFRKLDQSM